MTVAPLSPTPLTPKSIQTERGAGVPKPSDDARPEQQSVSVSAGLEAEIKDLLSAMSDRGFVFTAFTEDSARAAADAVKAGLGTEGQAIANADPDALARRF